MTASTQTVPATLGAIPFGAAERFGDAPAQRFKSGDEWHDRSHTEVARIVDELARGLIGLGIEPGARVAVLAETRPEWILLEYAISAAGAVVVPIYPSNSPDECDWVLRDSGSVAVVCENAGQADKIASVRGELPDLQHVLSIDPVDGMQDLAALRELGSQQDPAERARRTDAAAGSDPALIIYTSGTTGKPKGCVLTHANLTACVQQTVDLELVSDEDVCYLFLPLAHVFAQVCNIGSTGVGATVAYVSGGSDRIVADLGEVQPTFLPSVPRIFEKIYTLFAEAPRGEELDAQVRGVFGGRVRIAISGAAPIAPEILEFFHDAGVPVYEGYGLSETTAHGTLNLPDATRFGSIGRALPFGEVAIAEDGEILMHGPHLFAGYWNNPDATAEMFTEDGWLCTGDLGSIDEDGFVTITGRKKDIIITAGGKNLTPAEMENELRQSPLISYAVMHGDRRPFPVALITLDAEYAVPWAAAQGLPQDLATLADDEQVHQAIQQVLDEVNARHAQVAQIKKFALLGHDFSQETGELTATLKMKRAVIGQKYAELLDSLYQRAG